MDDTEIDLRSVFGLLARQFRLILFVTVSIVAVAALVIFWLPPTYSASSLILVDPSRKNLLDPDIQMNSIGSDSARIDSEVEIMRSDNVLLRVVQANNLADDPHFGTLPSLTQRILSLLPMHTPHAPGIEERTNTALRNLRDAVSVQRRGLTYLISVEVEAASPTRAAELANAIAETYITDQLASKVQQTLASRDVLQARILEARNAIAASETSFDSYIADNIDRISLDTGRDDLSAMQREILQLSAARVAGQRTLATTDGQALNVLQQSAEADRRREASLRETLRRSFLSSPLSADILTELFELQKTADLARDQYQLLLSRDQDLETQADLQLADSRIVSPALAPQDAAFPNRPLKLSLAALLAIGLGIALAFLYENFVGGFTNAQQLASVLKTRMALAIPRQKDSSEKESMANVMVASPLSIFAESIRRLRATMDQSLRSTSTREGGKLIMVSSTAPGEGKTTIALSLARSYALAGRRTLIIDGDLRKPSIHRHLGLEPSLGLFEFLTTDEDSFASIISPDALTPATVVLGARRSDVPTDQLLAGKSFGRLINAALMTFDIVIVDTSPVGPVVDALYVAPYADAILFVVRWSSTAQQDARSAVASLEQAKNNQTEIVAIINQEDQTRSTYMRKYGEYFAETV